MHLVHEICAGLPQRVVNLAGLTGLSQLAGLISQCDVLVTNDSGPMHIADAIGVPVVALFGSTSEVVTGPYRFSNAEQKEARLGRIIHKHVPCSPCYQRTCPIDFPCMKKIEADEVYEVVMQVVDAKKVEVKRHCLKYAKAALEKIRN